MMRTRFGSQDGAGTGAVAWRASRRSGPGIGQANDKAQESLGALQQAHSSLEQAQGLLQRSTEGSSQADVPEANGLLPQAIGSINEVQQNVQAAIQAAEGVASQAMSSLEEVRAMLLGAVEEIGQARRHAGDARGRLADAVGVLTGLGEHREPLVPPELRRATDELDRGLGLIGAGEQRIADIAARL